MLWFVVSVNTVLKLWCTLNGVDILMAMKTTGIIGLVVMLVAVFGGFWLYRATMPRDTEEALIPDGYQESNNSQFLQLQPKSLPPVMGFKEEEGDEESKEESDEEAVEESDQVSGSSKVQKEQVVGEVSGAVDEVIEDSGGESITDVDEPGVVISMTDLGFFPSSISVEKGTTVTFVNDGQSNHWPASDVHSAHNLLPGFDANKGITTGGVYSYKFTKIGEWAFHDHLNPDFVGTIAVE